MPCASINQQWKHDDTLTSRERVKSISLKDLQIPQATAAAGSGSGTWFTSRTNSADIVWPRKDAFDVEADEALSPQGLSSIIEPSKKTETSAQKSSAKIMLETNMPSKGFRVRWTECTRLESLQML